MVCGAFFVASRLVGPLVPYNAHSIRTMAKPTQAAMIKMGYGLLSEYIGVSFNPSIQRKAPDHAYRSFAVGEPFLFLWADQYLNSGMVFSWSLVALYTA